MYGFGTVRWTDFLIIVKYMIVSKMYSVPYWWPLQITLPVQLFNIWFNFFFDLTVCFCNLRGNQSWYVERNWNVFWQVLEASCRGQHLSGLVVNTCLSCPQNAAGLLTISLINDQTFNPQAYIPKRRTLIQVLPPDKFFCYLLMHICILPENCN